MTPERALPPQSVPTLTEVVAWPEAGPEPGAEPVREPPPGSSEEPVREPPAEPAPVPERGPAPVPIAEPPMPPAEPSPAPVQAQRSAPTAASAPVAAPVSEDQLTQRILADLQHQVDLVLEYRVREALTPILTRATDALVRDARAELSRSLRDMVARSVAQELRRQRSG
ncbi:MAG TPA: hypothetical protein VF319_11100 [Caldimonas sp.]